MAETRLKGGTSTALRDCISGGRARKVSRVTDCKHVQFTATAMGDPRAGTPQNAWGGAWHKPQSYLVSCHSSCSCAYSYANQGFSPLNFT